MMIPNTSGLTRLELQDHLMRHDRDYLPSWQVSCWKNHHLYTNLMNWKNKFCSYDQHENQKSNKVDKSEYRYLAKGFITFLPGWFDAYYLVWYQLFFLFHLPTKIALLFLYKFNFSFLQCYICEVLNLFIALSHTQ